MNRNEFLKAVSDYNKNQLSHHGIVGQKWGIKHGPPYPIDGSGLTTISKGSILHRISGNIDDDKATGHAYVTYGDDAKRYSGKFSYGRNWTNKDVYDQTYKVKKDMKGPSKEERVATFKEMYENDPSFKEAMKRAESEYKIKIPDEYESEENFTKLYKLFTKAIGSKDTYIRDTYFKILKDKGYDFVQDDLDTGLKMGTYPTIIFDRQECMEFVSRERIGMIQAAKNWHKYGGKVKHSADIYATSLMHHGIQGQKWGVRRFTNEDGTLTPEGKKRYSKGRVFVSGTWKISSEDQGYYREKLPDEVTKFLDDAMTKGSNFVIGDCVGVDAMVQKYLADRRYKNVDIYVTGDEVRNNADNGDLNWVIHNIASDAEYGSDEYHRAKDIAMSDDSDSGLAIILDNGANSTRDNIERLANKNKDVTIYQLNKDGKDGIKDLQEFLDERKAMRATSLSHYGIAGQKWGRRRWQYKDGSLTPEGYPHYGYNGPREAGNSDSTNKKKSKKSSESTIEKTRNNKAEKVGWAKDHNLVNFIPVTNLIGMTVDETTSIARNITYNNERKKSKTDPKTGLLLKNDNSLSMKDDAKRVNPNYGRAIQGTKNYSSNCQFCTMSYDLRRRGYEVQAGKRKTGGDTGWFAGMYKPPAEYTTFLANDLRNQAKLGKKNRHYTDAVNDEIRKQGDGARGQVSLGWDKWSGHSIAYEVKDGKVNYIDAQNGKMFNEKNFKNYVKHADDRVSVCRLDNIEPDIKAMKDSGVVKLDKKEKKGKGTSK